MSDDQSALPGIPPQAPSAQPPAAGPATAQPDLTWRTPLHAALDGFRLHMSRRDLAENTKKSFLYDLDLLSRYVGKSQPVGDISTKSLNDFVDWLRHGRGVPCNDKSLARRITSLKVFFGWLADTHVIPADPAAPIIQKAVSTPLPDILSEADVKQLLATTNMLRHADKPDARPHLLVSLLLSTGIKKSECMGIELHHLDFSEPETPVVWIRYSDPRHRLKERKLKLAPDWPRVLEEYKAQYQPGGKLFPWTPRNLEYVLRDVGIAAGLSGRVSFETLRWTCAVRDYATMSPEQVRAKMGLSKITWTETGEKLARLAARPL